MFSKKYWWFWNYEKGDEVRQYARFCWEFLYYFVVNPNFESTGILLHRKLLSIPKGENKTYLLSKIKKTSPPLQRNSGYFLLYFLFVLLTGKTLFLVTISKTWRCQIFKKSYHHQAIYLFCITNRTAQKIVKRTKLN